MSEKQTICLIVIGLLILVAFMYWINPWLTLALPASIFVTYVIAEYESRQKRIEELELKLKEAEKREEFLKESLADAKACNKSLRHQLWERENVIKELTRDHEAEIKQVELKAEQEITGGA